MFLAIFGQILGLQGWNWRLFNSKFHAASDKVKKFIQVFFVLFIFLLFLDFDENRVLPHISKKTWSLFFKFCQKKRQRPLSLSSDAQERWSTFPSHGQKKRISRYNVHPPLEIILRFWTNFPTPFARQNSTFGWVFPSLHFVLRVDARLTLGPAAAHGKRSAAMETQDPGPYRPWPHTGPVHIVNSQKWLKLQFWCYWNDWPLYGKKNYSTISYCKFELGILIIFINALFWETRTRKK